MSRRVLGLVANPESGGRYDQLPTHVEWGDGSFADYGFEIASDNLLPEDRVRYTDPETGGRALPPRRAVLRLAVAAECEYAVWSFLGEEHLVALLDQIRFVVG